MNIIRLALRKPIAVIVAVLAIGYFSVVAIKNIQVDIFPEIDSPSIYIAMPYGGLSPEHMDGFMAVNFQKVLIFVSGVRDMEFKSVQGLTLMKLSFYAGTDMAQASAEVATNVSRAMAFLPTGAVTPMVVRFDASALPVGQLVFESSQRSIGELQNLAISVVRPMFVNIPGITAPAPFGGNVRTIITNVDPGLMQSYGLSAEEVTLAIAQSNMPSPAGNVQLGDLNLMSPVNSLVKNPEELLNTPVREGSGPTVFVRDIATVTDGTDKTTAYALVNGKRTVYLPIVKKADASTLDAVNNLKASLPLLEAALPEDVSIDYAFDQSGYIAQSLSNLVLEGILGAVLTGLTVLLFLGDKRGSLIVVMTIPIAVLSAVIMLYLFGQTINVMTLSGLALAIGVLVDEATVTIENIHQHFETGKPKQRAILDALLEISLPKLLILLSILAVLTPSLMMVGIPKDMFMPLSMAVGFAMIASFLASQTFIPVMANWMMKNKHQEKLTTGKRRKARFDKLRIRHSLLIRKWQEKKLLVGLVYATIALGVIGAGISLIGTDIMPPSGTRDIQLRMIAPQGTRLEKTEAYVLAVEDLIRKEVGDGAVAISTAFVGMHSPNSPINPIFLFTAGSHEAVLQLSIDGDVYSGSIDELKEKIRSTVTQQMPQLKIIFEPMEMIEKIMSQGATTPVSIKVAGKNLSEANNHAKKIKSELDKVPFLRDINIAEPLDYPSISIEVDRELAAQFGLNMQEISQTLTTATSSSRYTHKNLWIDPESGLVFQVQVQVPENGIQSVNDLRSLSLKSGATRPILEDVATVSLDSHPGQVNRQGPNRYVTIVANIHKTDLGTAAKEVDKAIAAIGVPPKGLIVSVVGAIDLLKETLEKLQTGLVVAIVVVFLMLAAFYQSFKIPGVILSVLPAAIGGCLTMLLISGSTLNLQSYMGIIMAVGVSVSNAILIINQAEIYRLKHGLSSKNAARMAASSRLRPVLMTTCAMIAGMTPIALGIGEGGEQVAPLGQAVIGGLMFSTVASLLVLPHLYAAVQRRSATIGPSLDPDDAESKFFNPFSPKS